MSKNYQALKRELEHIVAKLQQEDLDIDEAIKLHEQGTGLVKELEKYLKSSENKVSKIKSA